MDKMVKCACGWEVRGNEEDVIKATMQHGKDVHNMEVTRDQVLAQVVPAT